MILKIVQVGDPVLRDPAAELTLDEIKSARIQELIALMQETMRDAPGVGLAAPQVGVSVQLAVIEDRPEYTKDLSVGQVSERERKPVAFQVIVNPKLTLGEVQVEFFEGCLSLAGFTALVPRARTVVVECLNERAEPVRIEASGWYARILQHEIDHLNGTLYIDRMRTRSFASAANYNRYVKDVK